MKLSSRWISVEERLPAIGQEVLTLFHQGNVKLILYSDIDEKNTWFIDTDSFTNPAPQIPIVAKYWTPLQRNVRNPVS